MVSVSWVEAVNLQHFDHQTVSGCAVVCAVMASAGMPAPGSTITPQDKGAWFAPCKHDVQQFFDPTRYKGRMPTTKPKKPLTPQGRGDWFVPHKRDVKQFFDPTRYRDRVPTPKPTPSNLVNIERHTTKGNILRFFDHTTYKKTSNHAQKRANEEPLRPVAKARMSRDELLEKFKLAASLNGLSWDDLVDPLMCLVCVCVRWNR